MLRLSGLLFRRRQTEGQYAGDSDGAQVREYPLLIQLS